MARKTKHWALEPAPVSQPAQEPTSAQALFFELTNDDDQFTGTSARDVIYGEGGNDTLDGAAGSDTLFGRSGDDFLFGGAGNDSLGGDEGLDILVGGTGADKFAFYGNVALDGDDVDVIEDFDAAEGNRIFAYDVFNRISSTGENPYDAGYVQAIEVSGSIQIQVDPDGGGDAFQTVALLEGTSLATLGGDYLFLG